MPEEREGGNAALLRLSALVCVLVALLVPGQVSADPVDSVADLVLGQPNFVSVISKVCSTVPVFPWNFYGRKNILFS